MHYGSHHGFANRKLESDIRIILVESIDKNTLLASWQRKSRAIRARCGLPLSPAKRHLSSQSELNL